MLDDLAFAVEAKDVNASSFLAGPIQITHVYDGKIPVDGNTFHLAGNAAGLLDVSNDAVEPVRKKRVVLNVWPGNKTRKQIGSALIKNLVVYNVDRLLDMLSCHAHKRIRVKYTTGRPKPSHPRQSFWPRPEYWQSDQRRQGSVRRVRGGRVSDFLQRPP